MLFGWSKLPVSKQNRTSPYYWSRNLNSKTKGKKKKESLHGQRPSRICQSQPVHPRSTVWMDHDGSQEMPIGPIGYWFGPIVQRSDMIDFECYAWLAWLAWLAEGNSGHLTACHLEICPWLLFCIFDSLFILTFTFLLFIIYYFFYPCGFTSMVSDIMILCSTRLKYKEAQKGNRDSSLNLFL